MVAIVVVLTAVAGGFVFGLFEQADPAPGVAFELEPVPDSHYYHLKHTGGEVIGGTGQTTVRGIAGSAVLHEEEFAAGEKRTVFPTAETVRVVWVGDHDNSYIIWETSVTSHVDLSPDEGCDWVAAKTNNGTDPITVDGLTVDCDIITEGDVDVVNGGTILGQVESKQNNVDLDGSTVYGPVAANGDVDLDGSEVTGSIQAEGNDVTITDGSLIGGDVSIGSGGNVDIDGGSTVQGSVSAGNAISLDTVTVEGAVLGGSGGTDISGSTIGGDVKTEGDLDSDSSTIGGQAYLGGSFSCSASDINGADCPSYIPRDASDY